MKIKSLQFPLGTIALKTHTKVLATFFIENWDSIKNPQLDEDDKIRSLTKVIKPFIKSIFEICDENERSISRNIDNGNKRNYTPLYPQKDGRYQRTDLHIKPRMENSNV